METQEKRIKDFIEYEVSNSWIAPYVSWAWLQGLLGKYYAWKVKRKYSNYKTFLARKGIARILQGKSDWTLIR